MGAEEDADGVGRPLGSVLVTIGTVLVALELQQLEESTSVAFAHSVDVVDVFLTSVSFVDDNVECEHHRRDDVNCL